MHASTSRYPPEMHVGYSLACNVRPHCQPSPHRDLSERLAARTLLQCAAWRWANVNVNRKTERRHRARNRKPLKRREEQQCDTQLEKTLALMRPQHDGIHSQSPFWDTQLLALSCVFIKIA